MHFSHHDDLWVRFPTLVPAVLAVRSVQHLQRQPALDAAVEALTRRARDRLAQSSEGDWPPIQAWRRTFSAMGLKPTQYRSAAEALLRRLRKEGSLPRLHPLVDLCNAVSVAWALPVAAFDLDHVEGNLTVCAATGAETHLEFSGALEQPEPGEIVFRDAAAHTHARRWCHRQSAASTLRAETSHALIVAEALHEAARDDVQAAMQALAGALSQAGVETTPVRLLCRQDPLFSS